MAVIHLAGAVASFLIAGYLLISSIFGIGFEVGLSYCSFNYCHGDTIAEGMVKFVVGIILIVFGVWIANKSKK